MNQALSCCRLSGNSWLKWNPTCCRAPSSTLPLSPSFQRTRLVSTIYIHSNTFKKISIMIQCKANGIIPILKIHAKYFPHPTVSEQWETALFLTASYALLATWVSLVSIFCILQWKSNLKYDDKAFVNNLQSKSLLPTTNWLVGIITNIWCMCGGLGKSAGCHCSWILVTR